MAAMERGKAPAPGQEFYRASRDYLCSHVEVRTTRSEAPDSYVSRTRFVGTLDSPGATCAQSGIPNRRVVARGVHRARTRAASLASTGSGLTNASGRENGIPSD